MDSKDGSLSEFFRKTVEASLESHISNVDDTQYVPATRLIEKRYEIQDIEDELITQQKLFNKRMDILVERKKTLKKRQTKLNDDITKLAQYLKENDVKCSRAIRKAYDERKDIEEKDKEIQNLKKLISQLKEVKIKQEIELKKGQTYHQFLESALEVSDTFPDLNDLLSRFEALQGAKEELCVRAKLVQDTYEAEQLKFQAWLEERKNNLLHQNNMISKLTEKLDGLQRQSDHWSLKIEASVSTAAKRSLEVGQIQTATNNLFLLVKFHRHHRVSHTSNPILQLEKVQKFIMDLTEILNAGLVSA